MVAKPGTTSRRALAFSSCAIVFAHGSHGCSVSKTARSRDAGEIWRWNSGLGPDRCGVLLPEDVFLSIGKWRTRCRWPLVISGPGLAASSFPGAAPRAAPGAAFHSYVHFVSLMLRSSP